MPAFIMKKSTIKKIIVNGLFGILGLSSIFALERITSEEQALSAEVGVIHILGESHIDEADIGQVKLLERLAGEGKIILGREGHAAKGQYKGDLFGLEDKALSRLSTAFISMEEFLRHFASKQFVKLGGHESDYSRLFKSQEYNLSHLSATIVAYIVDITDEKVLDEIEFVKTEMITNDILSLYLNGVLNELGKLKVGASKDFPELCESIFSSYAGSGQYGDNFFDNMPGTDDDWFNILNRILKYRYENVNEDIRKTLPRPSIMSLKWAQIYKRFKSMKSYEVVEARYRDLEKEISKFIELICINPRNRVFADSIIDECLRRGFLVKPFFVIVGSLHVEGTKEILKNAGLTVIAYKGGEEKDEL